MTTIRIVYWVEPNFPATDQHPDALRTTLTFEGNTVWVDYIGDVPTVDDVDAVVHPEA